MRNYRWKISNEIFCVNFSSQIKELEKQKKAADVYLTQIMRKLVRSMAPIHWSLLDLHSMSEILSRLSVKLTKPLNVYCIMSNHSKD